MIFFLAIFAPLMNSALAEDVAEMRNKYPFDRL